jgi:hypothetical protein
MSDALHASRLVTFDFLDGKLTKLDKNETAVEAWEVEVAPADFLRQALEWNDRNGDYDDLPIDGLRTLVIHQFTES